MKMVTGHVYNLKGDFEKWRSSSIYMYSLNAFSVLTSTNQFYFLVENMKVVMMFKQMPATSKVKL